VRNNNKPAGTLAPENAFLIINATPFFSLHQTQSICVAATLSPPGILEQNPCPNDLGVTRFGNQKRYQIVLVKAGRFLAKILEDRTVNILPVSATPTCFSISLGVC
jgi:hypothetical protein